MRKIILRNEGLKYPRICMITGPLPDSIVDADIVHIGSLLRLLEPLAEKIFVISSNLPERILSDTKIHIINIEYRSNSRWLFIRIPKFVIMQLKISYYLFKIHNKIEIVFLSIGAGVLILPLFLAKLMNKKTIYIYAGKDVLKKYSEGVYKKNLFGYGELLFLRIIGFLELLCCYFSEKIISNSSEIDPFLLQKYKNKISIVSRFFVDISRFKEEKDIDSRELLVGYIGKFNKGKGIMNFIKAIPLIRKGMNEIKFIICGDGTLRHDIKMAIKDTKIDDIVTITYWIPHDEVPNYLNEMKLLVISSESEVGPQILFESMACGTPVLATPVGVVPDVIKDGETGFIMKNNSPECISKNVLRVLNQPYLDKISKNARDLMEREYNYDSAIERYKKILEGF